MPTGWIEAATFRRAVLAEPDDVAKVTNRDRGAGRATRRLVLTALLFVPAAALAEPTHERAAPPPDPAALLARGDGHNRRGDLDRAIADYDAALKADPKLAEAHHGRGIAWRARGDRRRALADFDAALRLKPDFEGARASRRALFHEIERLGAQMPLQPPARK